jgi:hypothetical protein
MTGIFANVIVSADRIILFFERLAQGKYWLIQLTIILTVGFNIIYFPEAVIKRMQQEWTSQDSNIQQFLNVKISEPFKPFANAKDNDHLRKRELRFTPYLVGNLLGLDAAKLFYLQILLLPLFIYGVLKTLTTFARDKVVAILGTLCLLFCYVGNSFYYDTLFLDSYAYFGLLAAILLRGNVISIPILILTYFVDERSLVPSMIIPLLSFMELWKDKGAVVFDKETIVQSIVKNKAFWIILASQALYLVVRFYLSTIGLNTPVGHKNGVGFGIAFSYGQRLVPAILSSLKANFVILILGLMYLHKNRSYLAELWILGIFILSAAIAMSVEDVTRSLAYAFPVIFTFFLVMGGDKNNNLTRRFMLALACTNLLTPTYTLILDLIRIRTFGWISLIL